MTPEHSEHSEHNDELRRRREQREKRRQAQQRQAMLRLWLVLGMLVFAAALIIWVSVRAHRTTPTQPTDDVALTTTEPVASEPSAEADETTAPTEYPTTVIHIAAAGDLNVTDEIVTGAMNVSGYDFSDTFLDVAPVLGAADLTIMNFEGTLAGPPYGTQTGSAPAALVETLASCGVDVMQTANSASIRSGVLGLQSTLAGLRNAGIIPVGTFQDSDAFKKSGGFTLVEIQGIRIALVAFTKGMDNLGLPEGSKDCVNLIYEDYTTDYKDIDTEGITDVLRSVRAAEPDITIALLHWGSEYNENIRSSQESVAQLMLSNGVDAIIGTHSHLLHAIDYDQENKTLVAWSLGDFYGNATEPGSNYSVILDLEITMDNELGTAAITGYSTTPIYTLLDEQSSLGGQRVVRLESALARYENRYVGRVTDSAYEAMSYALKRIDQRINANKTEETEE